MTDITAALELARDCSLAEQANAITIDRMERDEAFHSLVETAQKANAERASLARALLALAAERDVEMERLKACEHIAEGESGWERLRHVCPSASAVAVLRDEREAMRAVVEAACDWRSAQVNVSSNRDKPYYIDSDDGNVDQGLMREPMRNTLIAAIDSYRAKVQR